jgi:hypothetical protein
VFWPFGKTAYARQVEREAHEIARLLRIIISNQGYNMQAIDDIKAALDNLRGDVNTLTASLAAEKTKVDQLIAIAERGASGMSQADLDQLASIKGSALDLSASVQKASADVQAESAAADAVLNPAPTPSPAAGTAVGSTDSPAAQS